LLETLVTWVGSSPTNSELRWERGTSRCTSRQCRYSAVVRISEAPGSHPIRSCTKRAVRTYVNDLVIIPANLGCGTTLPLPPSRGESFALIQRPRSMEGQFCPQGCLGCDSPEAITGDRSALRRWKRSRLWHNISTRTRRTRSKAIRPSQAKMGIF